MRSKVAGTGVASDKLPGVISAVAVAAATFVGGWEGLSLVAYPDRLANNLPTVCYGETRGVHLGDRYSKSDCDAMLMRGLIEFEAGLDRCLTAPVSPKTKVALVSWAYNVGLGAACGSTLVRKANAGDLVGACNQLTLWNKAKGRVIRGLTNRRVSERAMCLEGLK